jgi:DNA-binding NtrC family response regulator
MGIRDLVAEILSDSGYGVLTAADAHQAREQAAIHALDLILLDVWMPQEDGLALLREWAQSELPAPVVMLSGHATLDAAVEATRIGASAFLEKPLRLQTLMETVYRVLKDNATVSVHETLAPYTAGATPKATRPSAPVAFVSLPYREAREAFERAYFEQLLSSEAGKVARVAQRAGLERTHLYRKLQQLKIRV